jgi:hypothetical protein
MSTAYRYRRLPGLAVEYVDDRPCIAVGTDSWVVLEGTAVALWDLLTEPHTPRQLADRLSGTFAGPLAAIEDDVTAALDEWERGGLVGRDDRVD